MIIEKSPIKIISFNFISVIVAGVSHTAAPHPPLTHRETARDTIVNSFTIQADSIKHFFC